MGGLVAEAMCWVGGWLEKRELRLSQLSTKIEVEVDLKLSLAILQSVIFCDFYYFVFSIMKTLAMFLETTKFKTRGPAI